MEAAEDAHDSMPAEKRVEPPSPSGASKENQLPKKANVRKRTKTGCLTCRKRRIKCDEGKPTCNNCIKSKRQCEGYNTRVVFKEPLGTFQGGPFGPIMYRAGPTEALINAQLSSSQAKSSSSQGPLPIIAPKPPPVDLGIASSYQYGQPYPAQPRSASAAHINLAQGSYGSQRDAQGDSFAPPEPSQVNHSRDHLSNFQPAPSIHNVNDQFQEHAHPLVRRQSAFARIERPLQWTHPDDIYIRSQNTLPVAQDGEYWYSDDDASMVDSDDEALSDSHAAHLESNDLGIIVARKLHAPLDLFGTQMRSFHAFAEDNVLASYMPSSTNSPLNDSQTAAIFWYFVNVTGPAMSLYERHPFDPTPMFQGQPVPKARQHIWTYVFPIISLNHPALLQAMLALGSLQMAKLQGVPATASMKHYHLSIRRIAKNYQSTNRRCQPATLAATLLLGFYEVWNSDHEKWCKHMWGARAILREIPLRQMTASILAIKRSRHGNPDPLGDQEQQRIFTPDQSASAENDMDYVDVNLLSQLSGRPVSYEEDYATRASRRLYTERDLEDYAHLSDLFWWYCKMDVYQSFLGGTPLFMEYEAWSQCIPRAPIGRIDAIYGTFDHLMVLLGRLASFSSKDLSRKRKARTQEGGPGGPGGPGQGNSPPMFVGMFPARGHFTVPTGFSPPRDTSPQSDGNEDIDLEARTAAALREWEGIRQAFEIFQARLGPDFDPMGPEYEPPRPSPFGPAQTYRTYSIAGIWMNYYMGMIALYRAHPSMPPFAMVAAGMAARTTAPYAIALGRIAAGLAEDCSTVHAVSTLVGAAFIESCFCMFVAAVQYQDAAQRHWTVRRLHDIARLTGWQSARQIANGCEAAWLKAAALGRGPPYERDPTLEIRTRESVWANPRRIDARIQELSTDDGKRVVLARSEQAHYALGLLSVEQDLERLDLREAA